MHQISYCLVADVAGDKGSPALVDYEIEHGFRLEWMDIEDAIKTIEGAINQEEYDARFIAMRDLTLLQAAVKLRR